MEKIKCDKCGDEICSNNFNRHYKKCTGKKSKVNEEWKQENGLYKCPYCGVEKHKKGICYHIYSKHINPDKARETSIKNSGFIKKYGPGRKAKKRTRKYESADAYYKSLKDKTYEEIYGEERAKLIKKKLSESMTKSKEYARVSSGKDHGEKVSAGMKAKYKSGWKSTSGFKKTKYYNYNGIKVHGKLELKTCFILDEIKRINKIKDWEYTNDRFQYIGLDGKEHTYFIDFKVWRIDGSFHYLEVKGWQQKVDKLKWLEVINQGYELIVWKNREVRILMEELKLQLNIDEMYESGNNNTREKRDDYLNRIKKESINNNKPLIELILNSNIDFSKYGWVRKVAKLFNKQEQKINGWMKKYMPEFYENNCYKRNKK